MHACMMEAVAVLGRGLTETSAGALCRHIVQGIHFDKEPSHYAKEIHYFDSTMRFSKGS